MQSYTNSSCGLKEDLACAPWLRRSATADLYGNMPPGNIHDPAAKLQGRRNARLAVGALEPARLYAARQTSLLADSIMWPTRSVVILW